MKEFDSAKSRLRPRLTPDEIVTTIKALAQGVIGATAPRECAVLCSDDDVAEFVSQLGALVWRVTDAGLNEAVHEGYEFAGENFDRVIVAHADLAEPHGLGTVEFAPGVTIVADRHGLGTNVLALPTRTPFQFSYGDKSALLHHREAQRLSLPVVVLTNTPWATDVDDPEDLDYVAP
jgi:2-phospho-L-lactate guanylyltransferase